MAAAPVKSQPLHNFSLPSYLKWGGANTTNHRYRRPPHPPSPSADTTDKNYSAPETLPKTATLENDEEPSSQKPWNLRPRKPPVRNVVEFKEPSTGGGGGSVSGAEREENQRVTKSSRSRGHGEGSGGGDGERKEKRRFWISLSKEEIEEDVFVMTGSRPARRPKKRPRNVQKQLDIVFPGLWLVGITADAYRIAETPSKK